MKNQIPYSSFLFIALLTIILFSEQSNAKVNLYRLKSVEPPAQGYNAADILWNEASSDTTMFQKANGRTIIISFWGIWCGFCMRHVPELVKLYNYLPKDKYYLINCISQKSDKDTGIREVLEQDNVMFDNVWYSFNDSPQLQPHIAYNISQFISTVVISPERQILATIPDIIFQSFVDSLNNLIDVNENPFFNTNIRIVPNPLSNSTKLNYYVPVATDVKLIIYNAIGYKISEPINEFVGKGEHQVIFNTNKLPNGVYYYNMVIGRKSKTGQLVVNK